VRANRGNHTEGMVLETAAVTVVEMVAVKNSR